MADVYLVHTQSIAETCVPHSLNCKVKTSELFATRLRMIGCKKTKPIAAADHRHPNKVTLFPQGTLPKMHALYTSSCADDPFIIR